MTDKKISELTAITGADVDDANDVIAIVDSSIPQTKKITRAELFSSVDSVSLSGGTIDGATLGGTTPVDITADTATLAAIAATKVETAVDVFVYDTSRDSDGGAWRKRTQHTSWYNETLNTATRGSRREFPSVAVIVAESNKVTIYDGDDPSLPMWMVFNAFGGLAGTSGVLPDDQLSALYASNAIIAMPTDNSVTDGRGGVKLARFIHDDARNYSDINTYNSFNGTLSQRNDALGYIEGDLGVIASREVNDVAMTVLPDAPIDPATGLPVPTIAVATDGGVSVIKDDGTVVDITATVYNKWEWCGFYSNSVVASNSYLNVRGQIFIVPIPNADFSVGNGYSTNSIEHYTTWRTTDLASLYLEASSNGATITSMAVSDSSLYAKGAYSLISVSRDVSDPTNGMVNNITSTYNTGWMNGDIKGAFLSDTDDTDLVGSGELVTNGDFSTNDFTGWTVGSSDPDADASTGAATFGREVGASDAYIQQIITIVAGKKYAITFEVTAGSGRLEVRDAGVILATYTSVTLGYKTIYYSATDTNIDLRFVHRTEGATVTLDNISIVEADADRSVNNNGLIVNGTVTRSPVATGADLVAYSGFSSSNYLEQPYNSDLDFGTGDFCVMGWFKTSGTGLQSIGSRFEAASAGADWNFYIQSSTGFLEFNINGSTVEVSSAQAYNDGIWHFGCVTRKSGVLNLYADGLLKDSAANTTDLDNASAVLGVGVSALASPTNIFAGSLALLRISATAPTAEQIAKIYEDEKFLFQENAQATLYGSSDAVTALAHDPVTDLLHVGTSAGRSVFQGLRRVDNTTDAVGTAISASNNLVVEE